MNSSCHLYQPFQQNCWTCLFVYCVCILLFFVRVSLHNYIRVTFSFLLALPAQIHIVTTLGVPKGSMRNDQINKKQTIFKETTKLTSLDKNESPIISEKIDVENYWNESSNYFEDEDLNNVADLRDAFASKLSKEASA